MRGYSSTPGGCWSWTPTTSENWSRAGSAGRRTPSDGPRSGRFVLVGRPGQGQREGVVQGVCGDAAGMLGEVVADLGPPIALGADLVAHQVVARRVGVHGLDGDHGRVVHPAFGYGVAVFVGAAAEHDPQARPLPLNSGQCLVLSRRGHFVQAVERAGPSAATSIFPARSPSMTAA